MADFAEALVRLSLTVSIAILAIATLRPVFRKFGGPVVAYGLWALVPLAAVAALLPTPAGVNLIPDLASPIVSAVTAAAPVIDQRITAAIPAPVKAALDFTPALLSIWVAVTLALIVRLVWMEARLARLLSGLRPDPDQRNVFYMDGDGVSPMVVGLWRSRIILPSDFPDRYEMDERRLILAHERAHLRARHLPAGALAYVLFIAQWFNPLAHLAIHLFRIDQELACDAMVVAAYPQQKAVYARAMFKTGLSRVSAPLACGWAKGPTNPTRRRIAMLQIVTPGRAQRRLAGMFTTLTVLGGSLVAYAASPSPAVQRAVLTSAPVQAVVQAIAPAAKPVRVAAMSPRIEITNATPAIEPVEVKPVEAGPPFSFLVPLGMTMDEAAQAMGLPDRTGYGIDAGAKGEFRMVRCGLPQTPSTVVCRT